MSVDDQAAWETSCPRSDDDAHCEHWYDDAGPCCFCGDDGDRGHGDHHPALDCATCSDRIRQGLTTYAQVYRLEENRYRNHVSIRPPPRGANSVSAESAAKAKERQCP